MLELFISLIIVSLTLALIFNNGIELNKSVKRTVNIITDTMLVISLLGGMITTMNFITFNLLPNKEIKIVKEINGIKLVNNKISYFEINNQREVEKEINKELIKNCIINIDTTQSISNISYYKNYKKLPNKKGLIFTLPDLWINKINTGTVNNDKPIVITLHYKISKNVINKFEKTINKSKNKLYNDTS